MPSLVAAGAATYFPKRRVDRPVDRAYGPVDRPVDLASYFFFIFFSLNFKTSKFIFVAQTISVFKSLYMKLDQKNETDAMAQLP